MDTKRSAANSKAAKLEESLAKLDNETAHTLADCFDTAVRIIDQLRMDRIVYFVIGLGLGALIQFIAFHFFGGE